MIDLEKKRASRRAYYYRHHERILAEASVNYHTKEGKKTEARRRNLKNNFGISLEKFDELLDAQRNVCAICGGGPKGKPSLSVDHCHKTEKIRGLLCTHCNSGLGMFRDSPELLREAAAYIEANK